MVNTVKIDSLAYGGRGVGRLDGKVVFVPFTAPGDVAGIRIEAEKKGFSEGSLVELLEPSPMRVEPRCGVYGVCGGCNLQHIGYGAQLELKKGIFEDTLKRIGKAGEFTLENPVEAAPFNYRSRARFHRDGEKWGFHEIKSHRVVDIQSCPIADESVNRAFGAIKDALSDTEKAPPVFSVEIGSGGDGSVAAAFYLSGRTSFDWKAALQGTGLKGFEVWVSPVRRERGKKVLSYGDPVLEYSAGGLEFRAPVSSFSQVNRQQNELMVRKTVEYASLSGGERVLELFCGAGNLTLPLASRGAKITGVEAVPEAIRQAEDNAAANSVKGAHFIASEARSWVWRNIKDLEKEKADMVVLDPPRGGEPEVVRALARLRPGKVVYISCSPPTLARDVSSLIANGYRLARAGLFDMFPQTYHIEGITELVLSD